MVPESCQRTDGIKAWLEEKEEEKEKEFQKAKSQREKAEEFNTINEERNARSDKLSTKAQENTVSKPSGMRSGSAATS